MKNQNWRTFYTTMDVCTSKKSIAWKTKAEKVLQIKEKYLTTQCITWSWSRQLICDKDYRLEKKKNSII